MFKNKLDTKFNNDLFNNKLNGKFNNDFFKIKKWDYFNLKVNDPKFKNLVDFYIMQYNNGNISKNDLNYVMEIINILSVNNKKLQDFNLKMLSDISNNNKQFLKE